MSKPSWKQKYTNVFNSFIVKRAHRATARNECLREALRYLFNFYLLENPEAKMKDFKKLVGHKIR